MVPSSACAPGAAPGCFHCGLPLPAGPSFGFDGGDGWRTFCCAGCEAVSRAISGLGLDDYYRLREAPAARPETPPADDLAVYDDALVQSRFVRTIPGGGADACLVIEGMRCPACAWLLERVLAREPGVASFEVNFTTRRARLAWDPGVVRLSRLLAAVRSVGYTAWPHEPGRLALVETRERRALLRRLWVAGLAMMQVMMYAVPAYLAGEGEMTADVVQLMRWAGLVLTAPVLAYSAAPFLVGAWRDLSRRRAGMDVPIALGLAAATAASVVATLRGQGDVYFDSITMFVFLLLGARYLEVVARGRAGDALQHLARLIPQAAHRFAGPGDALEEVAVARLAVGDRVLVRPGETVPADGILESDEALVSEAWLSGESRAIARARGERLVGGGINAGSACVIRVERVGEETALSAIQRMMERALADRPRWVEAAQRASEFFVAAVLAVAAAAGVGWLFIDAARAPWVAVAVLVVTCPCALALAAPLAATAACGALARANLVVSRAAAIEGLAGASDVVFDKTGTLTYGRPRLLQTVPLGRHGAAHALSLAARLARWSAHPIDQALAQAGGMGGGASAERHQSFPGAGIEGWVAGARLRLGRAAFVQELHGRPTPLTWIRTTDTTVFLGDERGWIAGFRLGDEIRPEARAALARLRGIGLRVHLLSGDERGVAEAVAAALAIDHVIAPSSPEGKLAYVRDLQQAGARVVMVGDGINDAPVLARADVSVAMGGGADLAQVRADAVLLSDSLDDFADACLIARKARRVTRQNLAWALAYNLVALPVAVAGVLTPLLAAVGMSLSSLAVVANVLRLRIRVRPPSAIP
jgi:Cu2+-exporting ATPase